ncbi:MAG: cytochrome c [Candidatus Lambdaproteobacteria bacterium]|nr:cytochrome c [Candidatus Lambdaproteobacteria bacterium]
MRLIRNALVQCLAVLLLALAVLLAVRPPIPASLLTFYLAVIGVGLGVYITATTERMESFWRPLHALLILDRLRPARWGVLLALPVLAAGQTAWSLLPTRQAPATLRVIHPAPPTQIRFEGRSINLREARNPLRAAKASEPRAFAAHVETGRRVYYQNCFQCHGDNLAGDGPFAHAFNPRPANFQDLGTIAQLQESYLFWRIAKGGPGLPPESAPGRSAMPRWEGRLSEEEIWAVILFLYEMTGHPPRTWD